MRRWMAWAIILVLVSTAVFAELCTDSDGGGDSSNDNAITVKGETKYGITTLLDTCLTSQNGVSAETGVWLKEYYCDDDKRESNAYNCINLGYTSCEYGACLSSGNASNTTQQQQQTSTSSDSCGNDITEKDLGEECDPPSSICFGKTSAQYGVCKDDCTCKIAASAEAAPAVCGDEYLDEGEECEKDEDCADNHVCSSCSCVKELTPEEIEAMKQSSKEEKAEGEAEKEKAKEEIAEEIEEEFKAPEDKEVNLTATNFSDDPGIKATSGIAKFFTGIWNWIAGLFS